jgi:hypothetical protein
MALKLANGALIDAKERHWSLNEILGLAFDIKIGKTSTVIVVVKADKSVLSNDLRIGLHLSGFALLAMVGLYLCEFSVVLVCLLGLLILARVAPSYLETLEHLSKVNVKTYSFEDPVDIVQLQKGLWEILRGRILIKRGLLFGETGEQVLSVVLPSSLFDSIFMRKAVKFAVDVLYPMVVVLLPMVFGLLSLASPAWRQLKHLSKKDLIVKFLLMIYELFAANLSFISPYYWLTQSWTWILNFNFDMVELLDWVLGWLKTEVALLLLKLDFLYAKKLKLLRSLSKLRKYICKSKVVKVITRSCSPIEKPIHIAVKRIKPELVQELYEPVTEISSQTSKLKKQLKMLKEVVHNEEEEKEEVAKKYD